MNVLSGPGVPCWDTDDRHGDCCLPFGHALDLGVLDHPLPLSELFLSHASMLLVFCEGLLGCG